jgi:hypothetical protein
MIRPALLLLVAAAAACALAQSPVDQNEGSKLEHDEANGIWRFKWWAKSGRTYFLQHSDNLTLWNWVPIVESGNDSLKEWGFSISGDRFFVRLRHTDQTTTDPENDDFDDDGVPNLAEVAQGLDPFNPDTDGDGLPDGWEIANGLDPLFNDASADADGDGFTNLEEFHAGLNPQDHTNGVTGHTALLPAAPTNVAADKPPGTTLALITWSDQSNNELLFFIERSENGGPWQKIGTVPANAVSFTDHNLSPDGVYYYRVVSRNNVPE